MPPNNDPLWQRLNKLGITVNTQERGAGGGEIAVDECIQLEMANRVLDIAVPETMVLLTGDGSGYLDGKGFIKQLERAKNRAWSIEVISCFQEPNEPDSASGQIAALLHAAGHDSPVAVGGACRDDGANGIGAAAIANPLFGTTTDQIAALGPPRSDTPLGAQQEIGSLSPLSTAR